MPPYVLRRGAVTGGRLEALRHALLASPLVARSTLAGSFQHTRGFAITFTREGEEQVRSRFPHLGAFLDLLGKEPRALEPFFRRHLGRAPPGPNAFYLNLLLVSEGGAVRRHTDATLRGPSGVADAIPQRVTVLYLTTPEGEGGELRLFRRDVLVGQVRPQEGALVHFRGDLQHEVAPFRTSGPEVPRTDDASAPAPLRASLVCEQYVFDEVALDRLPPCQVQSKAGFDGYLRARRPV